MASLGFSEASLAWVVNAYRLALLCGAVFAAAAASLAAARLRDPAAEPVTEIVAEPAFSECA